MTRTAFSPNTSNGNGPFAREADMMPAIQRIASGLWPADRDVWLFLNEHNVYSHVPDLVAARLDIGTLRDRIDRMAAVVSPLVGSALYLVWVGREYGDAWLPLRLQNEAHRRGGFANPVARLFDGFADLFGGDRFGSGLHVVWALVFVALVVVLAARLPASYAAYAGATVVFGLAAENLDSFERYAMSAFPLVLAVALVTKRDDVERPAIVLAGAGLVGYAVLGFLGRYVP